MNEKTITLKNALRSFRQRGSTTYLLKAAVEMPNVTIITANQVQAKELERQYNRMLMGLPLWKKLLRKLKGSDKKGPSFVSVQNSKEWCAGRSKNPVIVDLYAVASSL